MKLYSRKAALGLCTLIFFSLVGFASAQSLNPDYEPAIVMPNDGGVYNGCLHRAEMAMQSSISFCYDFYAGIFLDQCLLDAYDAYQEALATCERQRENFDPNEILKRFQR
ncbi:MAG: hypothetical protein KDD62_05725 [Bdellovibrionales bacterium]|nr:hypothetical protein [Bdellovibrionales bacterium]